MKHARDIDEYIASFPADIRQKLEQMRTTIRNAAPGAEESISYGMPAYKTGGRPLVYFGGFKTHIGFYATPTGHAAFKKELSAYKEGKGSAQFPLDQELPLGLISRIVRFRLTENRSLAEAKTRK